MYQRRVQNTHRQLLCKIWYFAKSPLWILSWVLAFYDFEPNIFHIKSPAARASDSLEYTKTRQDVRTYACKCWIMCTMWSVCVFTYVCLSSCAFISAILHRCVWVCLYVCLSTGLYVSLVVPYVCLNTKCVFIFCLSLSLCLF